MEKLPLKYALGMTTVLALGGCSLLPPQSHTETVTITVPVTPDTLQPTTEATPTTSAQPTIVPTQNFAPKRTEKGPAKLLPNGLVAGGMAYFDLPNVTPGGKAVTGKQKVETVNKMFSCGNESDRLLITIDDHGTPDHIEDIMDALDAKGVGAVFFPNYGDAPGKQVNQVTIDHIRERGFYVGNHTASHADLVPLSVTRIKKEITSGGTATMFRPPYGATYFKKNDPKIYFDNKVKVAADALGTDICLWQADSLDWSYADKQKTKRISANQIVQNIKKDYRRGASLLFHMVDGYNTLEALPLVINDARSVGYEFCEKSLVPTTRDFPERIC